MSEKNVTDSTVAQDMQDAQDNFDELYAAISAATSGSGVKITVSDTTLGSLNDKLQVSPGITKTVNNPGGNETMTLGLNTGGDPTPEFGGDVQGNDHKVKRVAFMDTGEVTQTLGVLVGDKAIDLEAGNVATLTIGADIRLSFTNAPASGVTGYLVLMVTNGGAFMPPWPVNVKWSGDKEPTCQAAGLDYVLFTTIDSGVNWRGIKIDMGVI